MPIGIYVKRLEIIPHFSEKYSDRPITLQNI